MLAHFICYVLSAIHVRSPYLSITLCIPTVSGLQQRARGCLSIMLQHSVALPAEVTLFGWRGTLAVVLLHKQSAGLQGWVWAWERVCERELCIRHWAVGGLEGERLSLLYTQKRFGMRPQNHSFLSFHGMKHFRESYFWDILTRKLWRELKWTNQLNIFSWAQSEHNPSVYFFHITFDGG